MKSNSIIKHGIAIGLLLAFGLIGFMTYDDYGLSWDEGAQFDVGEYTYRYIAEGDTTLLNFKDKDYGVAMELPLYAIGHFLDFKSGQEVFQFRHIAAHLVFLFSAWCFYLLLLGIYKKQFLASAGLLIYILQPVIYAHSFFNTKDIPALAMYVICFYALYLYHQRANLRRLLLLSFCTALLLNLRLSGLIFVGIVGLYVLTEFLRHRIKVAYILRFGLFLVFSFVFLYITWPYLWNDPFTNLWSAIQTMIHFRWTDDLLLFGEIVNSKSLPWYYLPAWIGLNNSIVIICFSLFGILFIPVLVTVQLLREKKLNTELTFNFLFWVLLVVSLGSVFVLKPYLYDSWRQFFYLGPFVLLCAIYCFNWLITNKKGGWLSWSLMIYVILHYAWSIYILHPYSQVYFTELEDKNTRNHLRHTYEMDYWATGYRAGMEYIMAHDKRERVRISTNTVGGAFNEYILKPEDEKRVDYVKENPDYFISCYRYHPQDYTIFSEDEIIFQIERYNNVLLTVFKLRRGQREVH